MNDSNEVQHAELEGALRMNATPFQRDDRVRPKGNPIRSFTVECCEKVVVHGRTAFVVYGPGEIRHFAEDVEIVPAGSEEMPGQVTGDPRDVAAAYDWYMGTQRDVTRPMGLRDCQRLVDVFRDYRLEHSKPANGKSDGFDVDAELAAANSPESPDGSTTRASFLDGLVASYSSEVLVAINKLRAEEGNSVSIMCDNPDFNGQPNNAVECCGDWTDWDDRRFTGDTLLAALQAAVAAKAGAA